jgi:hypothetical protein
MLALERSKRLDTHFKERAVNVVEGEKANERAQRLAIDRKGPVVDEVEFGFGRAVAIRGDIMTDILDAVSKKFTLFQLKRDTVFHKHITHTFKQTK